MHKNIPNLLTIARLLVGIAIPLLLLKDSPVWTGVCLAIYLGGVITDILDGHLSRKHNCVSDFGKILDPIADKILNLGALFSFAFLEVFSVLLLSPSLPERLWLQYPGFLF
jgi:phosphatidylglycerophosphate synthase